MQQLTELILELGYVVHRTEWQYRRHDRLYPTFLGGETFHPPDTAERDWDD